MRSSRTMWRSSACPFSGVTDCPVACGSCATFASSPAIAPPYYAFLCTPHTRHRAHDTARAADSCLLRQITHVSPQIGNLSKLTEFVPYTSYNLHWLPYEVHDTRLPKAHISRRAMYGYSDRLPLPRLAPFPTGACRVRACVRCRGWWLAARLMVVRQVRSRSRRPPHAWWCPTVWTKASSPPSWSTTSTRPTAAPIATSTSYTFAVVPHKRGAARSLEAWLCLRRPYWETSYQCWSIWSYDRVPLLALVCSRQCVARLADRVVPEAAT